MKLSTFLTLSCMAAAMAFFAGCQTLTPSEQTLIDDSLNGVAAVAQAYVGEVLTPEVVSYIKQGAGTGTTGTLAANTAANLLPEAGQVLTQAVVNSLYALANPAPSGATAATGTAPVITGTF